MRSYRAVVTLRRFIGLALAVAGMAVVIDSLPGYLWILLLGFGLIWAGWAMFSIQRIY